MPVGSKVFQLQSYLARSHFLKQSNTYTAKHMIIIENWYGEQNDLRCNNKSVNVLNDDCIYSDINYKMTEYSHVDKKSVVEFQARSKSMNFSGQF